MFFSTINNGERVINVLDPDPGWRCELPQMTQASLNPRNLVLTFIYRVHEEREKKSKQKQKQTKQNAPNFDHSLQQTVIINSFLSRSTHITLKLICMTLKFRMNRFDSSWDMRACKISRKSKISKLPYKMPKNDGVWGWRFPPCSISKLIEKKLFSVGWLD